MPLTNQDSYLAGGIFIRKTQGPPRWCVTPHCNSQHHNRLIQHVLTDYIFFTTYTIQYLFNNCYSIIKFSFCSFAVKRWIIQTSTGLSVSVNKFRITDTIVLVGINTFDSFLIIYTLVYRRCYISIDAKNVYKFVCLSPSSGWSPYNRTAGHYWCLRQVVHWTKREWSPTFSSQA